MALNTLTLSVTQGVQGRPFEAAVSGQASSNVLTIERGYSPGFSVINGRLMSPGLPYQVTTAAIRETNPNTGETKLTTIDIAAMTKAQRDTQAATAVPGYASYRLVETYQADRTYAYYLAIKDALGGTTPQAIGVVVPTLTLTGPLTLATTTAPGTLVANIGNVPAGATPTLTPNDGRLAIAGSAGAWTAVVGMTASSAGTIALTVSAAGATSASALISVTVPAFTDTFDSTTVTFDTTTLYTFDKAA